MSALNSILLLAVAFVAVFLESAFDGVRRLAGAQIDLLPALVAYAALQTGWATVSLLAVLGGLWFDALSANPLGVTVLPLFAAGVLILLVRDFFLRDHPFALIVFGFGASAAVPLVTVLLLLSAGAQPLLTWFSLWQWAVMAVCGAAATPLIAWLFGRFNRALAYQPAGQTSFRADREIKRGRD